MRDLRPDRFLSIGLARPLFRYFPTARPSGIPILMYHKIRDGLGARHAYFETRTSPSVFERQMQYLQSHGYQTITLNQPIDANSTSVPSKAVVITFDDGYRDFYTEAFPILNRLGLSATVFLISGLVGSNTSIAGKTEYMSWNEVRDAYAHGITFGSHTMTHPQLERLTSEELDRELDISKRTIESELGTRVYSFSYPNAFPEHNRKLIDRLRAGLKSFGYENAVSTLIGTASCASDPYALPRLPINSHDDLHLFQVKLEGAYNWMRQMQSAWKRFA